MLTYPSLTKPKDILIVFPDNKKLFKTGAMFFDLGITFNAIKKQLNLEGGFLNEILTSFNYARFEFQPIPSGFYIYRPFGHGRPLKPLVERIKVLLKYGISRYHLHKYIDYHYSHIKENHNSISFEINGIKYKYNYVKKYYIWKSNNIRYKYDLQEKSLTWNEDVYKYCIKSILIKSLI